MEGALELKEDVGVEYFIASASASFTACTSTPGADAEPRAGKGTAVENQPR